MSGGSKPVLLAIDDDAIILNTVIATLKRDYSVRPFTSGETALKYLAGQTADLILLDNKMPGMNGFEVLKELQAAPRLASIPTIFLTGSTDGGESEVEALELGAVDYIHKPVKPRALLTRVRLQLELQNHRKRLEALVEEKNFDLNRAYRKLETREDMTLNLLARVTDLRDNETGGHIERTTEFVRVMTEFIRENPQPDYLLTPAEAADIIRSAKLHDLGKVATPDGVLLKPGLLTKEDFDVIKMHPVHGAMLLEDFIGQIDDPFLTTARDIAYAHHEKWDGSGYPLGLKGLDIPLSARIVAVADVYDALTSVRPYKKAYSHEKAMDIIRENRGRHFDPYLVDIFERHAAKIVGLSEASGAPGLPGASALTGMFGVSGGDC